jgi:hypothetical protein
VVAIAAIASLAVAQSDRDPLVPEEWVPLPRLSAAVPAGGVIKARQAFGDPSKGVYLFVQKVELQAGITVPALTAEVAKTLKAKGFEVEQATATGADFRLADTRGGFRISAGASESARVITCFYNERDPKQSSQTCAAVLDESETPK